MTKRSRPAPNALEGLWQGTKRATLEKLRADVTAHATATAKIGVGIKQFKISRNALANGLEVSFVRLNGTSEHFSYRKCVLNCDKKRRITSEASEHLRRAMRTAIQPQIYAFRVMQDLQDSRCALCASHLAEAAGGEVHVDHESPLFETLVRDFLLQWGGPRKNSCTV